MKIEDLWKGYNYPKCENCKKDCSGRLDYDNLCSNINYLKEYAVKNYEKNKESFQELKNIMGDNLPTIYSFGCGIGLDYLGAKEVFGQNFKYYGIDECNWAITKTENYKNFTPQLPHTLKFDVGTFLLAGKNENPIICFFNSLFTISNNTNLQKELIEMLENKDNFYIICDYKINNNYHMPKVEQDFLKSLIQKLKNRFNFKRFEILDGKGIIIYGKRK